MVSYHFKFFTPTTTTLSNCTQQRSGVAECVGLVPRLLWLLAQATPTASETARSLHLQLQLQALPSKEHLTEPLNRQLRCSPAFGAEHLSKSWSSSLCLLNARGGAAEAWTPCAGSHMEPDGLGRSFNLLTQFLYL